MSDGCKPLGIDTRTYGTKEALCPIGFGNSRNRSKADPARCVLELGKMRRANTPTEPTGQMKTAREFLRENLNRRAISNHRVDLLDLPIADGNTTRCPVSDIERLYSASGAAVDEDISSGRATLFDCKGSVDLIWIGDTDGQMVKAIRVAPVNDVAPLGRLSIAFELLVPFRCKAKTNRVCFQ